MNDILTGSPVSRPRSSWCLQWSRTLSAPWRAPPLWVQSHFCSPLGAMAISHVHWGPKSEPHMPHLKQVTIPCHRKGQKTV